MRDLTKELDIYMIVDEVQTGVGITGKFWAHEHWQLDSPPDFVTFAKKMLSSGFYSTDSTRMVTPYRHFNTFLGDPPRAVLTATMNQVIQEDGLVDQAARVGKHLKA